MSKFEVFTKRLVPLKKTPLVTIQKRGTISLNKSAFSALGNPEAVELLYDRDEQVIGLREAEATLEHVYPVRSSTGRDNGPFIISAIAFTRFYDIDTTSSRRWPAHLDDDVLCIDLATRGTPVTSNRAGGHRNDAGNDPGSEAPTRTNAETADLADTPSDGRAPKDADAGADSALDSELDAEAGKAR